MFPVMFTLAFNMKVSLASKKRVVKSVLCFYSVEECLQDWCYNFFKWLEKFTLKPHDHVAVFCVCFKITDSISFKRFWASYVILKWFWRICLFYLNSQMFMLAHIIFLMSVGSVMMARFFSFLENICLFDCTISQLWCPAPSICIAACEIF